MYSATFTLLWLSIQTFPCIFHRCIFVPHFQSPHHHHVGQICHSNDSSTYHRCKSHSLPPPSNTWEDQILSDEKLPVADPWKRAICQDHSELTLRPQQTAIMTMRNNHSVANVFRISCDFYRASICEGVLGVVILSVCLSVCPSVCHTHGL